VSVGDLLPQWATDLREQMKDHETRLRLVEKLLWIVFGIGSGVGAIATLIGSGTLKALLKAIS
jgi:hypothetical protein